MLRLRRPIWLALVCVSLVVAQGRCDEQVRYAPEASWVDTSLDAKDTPTPPEEVAHGYDFLLLDNQVNVAEGEAFHRSVYRITAESALQSGARFTWSYDPGYQTLTLHHLRLIRDGVAQDRLDRSKVQVIQQEKDLDRHMLDGRLTALVILDDVRVGDVIDYASSLRGTNPVFDGRYSDSFSTGWSVPVRHWRVRVTAPAGRTLTTKIHAGPAIKASTLQRGDAVVQTWEGGGEPTITAEDELPSWFDPYPWLQLTEYPNWGAVTDWALPLYAMPETLPDVIVAKASALTRGLGSDEDKAREVLRFVQQEIRYLGLELGAGTHRPNPPEVVLARRFGDCKDKVLLFCALMRAAGLEARPALVNTRYRDRIREWAATPYAFDHVIAYVTLGGRRWWVDPTLSYQGGGPSHRWLPDYRLALPVVAGGDRLVEVSRPEGALRKIEVEEQFDVTGFDVPAALRVTSRYFGAGADTVREYFATRPLAEITKEYVNYYASSYPGLSSAGAIRWRDDPATNMVTVEEHYSVPNLWKAEKPDGVRKASFYPQLISDYAVQPKTRVRTMPFRVVHPVKVRQTTRVNLPEDWQVTPAQTLESGPAFRMTDAIERAGRVVTMKYEWESLGDHVPPEKIAAQVESIKRVRERLGYELTHTPKGAAAGSARFRFNWLPVVVILFTVAVVFYAARKLWGLPRLDPPPAPGPGEERLVGLGGWLGLVGFGVLLRPVMLVVQLAADCASTFDLNTWEALTTPGGPAYRAGYAPLLLGEVVGNTLVLSFSVLMVGLYFRKKRAFPGVFIGTLVFNIVFIAADTWAASHLVQLENSAALEQGTYAGRMLVQALIWIPYMLVSRRVALTFTR